MPRKFLRRFLPTTENVRGLRIVALFGRLLHHPNLWHLNRDSVAGAVAIGLLAGLIPGPLQMLGAALLAIPLRRNLPVALAVTLYTNPFTIVPLYLVAWEYGRLLLGESGVAAAVPPFTMDWSDWGTSTERLVEWAVALGKPLAVGLPALALTLAAVGYAAVQIGWRAYVRLAWRGRRKRRTEKQPPHQP